MNVTAKVAEFVANTDWEALPPPAVDRAPLLMLDSLGVSLGAVCSPAGALVLRMEGGDAFGSLPATGSHDGVTAIGLKQRTSVATAAWINGTLAHAPDMDDTAAGTVAHPSAMLVPGLMAVGERQHSSGRAVLGAYIVGLEVFYRVALATHAQMRGWHRTSVYGALATAAAAARLLDCSAQQIAVAMGIAGSFASGLQANFGTMTKALQVGHASRSGVMAAMLAKEGASANPDVLGDASGFGHAFYADEFDTSKLVERLGDPYSIVSPGIGLKIHPCCGLTHTPADLVLELVQQHNIAPDSVQEIVVTAEPLLATVLVYPRPQTGDQGKYSLEYVVAAALFDRQIVPETFTDAGVMRPRLQAFLERVRLKPRPDADWPADVRPPLAHPAEVEVRLVSGERLVASAPCARGYPRRPLTSHEVEEKFRRLAGQQLSVDQAGQIIEHVRRFAQLRDVADVMRLTAAAR
ncbi:MAG: MmgE/PrpD family protein [Proteobacteria bacterium]|nr:MmgE/PrpD family protein [Pseudomonadota bacterium]